MPQTVEAVYDGAVLVVMSERAMTKALTADEHFQQCGFRALLREGSD